MSASQKLWLRGLVLAGLIPAVVIAGCGTLAPGSRSVGSALPSPSAGQSSPTTQRRSPLEPGTYVGVVDIVQVGYGFAEPISVTATQVLTLIIDEDGMPVSESGSRPFGNGTITKTDTGDVLVTDDSVTLRFNVSLRLPDAPMLRGELTETYKAISGTEILFVLKSLITGADEFGNVYTSTQDVVGRVTR